MVSPIQDAPPAVPANTCSVCQQCASKYKCPGCQAPTCSLTCCKQHKQQTGCSGKRDRLAFVPMQDFSDRHLMSDYRWLEEVNRVDDNAKRHRPPIPRRELPQHLSSLVHQARLRGVRLLIMPPGMHRRQTNSTRYDPRSRKLFWRLEWRFPAAAAAAAAADDPAITSTSAAAAAAPAAATGSAPAAEAFSASEAAAVVVSPGEPQQQPGQQPQQQCRVVLYDGRVEEESLLSTVLGRHLQYRQGAGAQALALQHYREAGAAGLTVLMKKERCPANAVRYYRLDISQSLKSQLAGKLVIEYPTLIVLLPGDDASHDVITPEELQAEEQARQGHHQGFRQQQGRPGGYPWPPPPPPPPRAPKPEQQQEQQEQEQEQDGQHEQQEPPAKRHCSSHTPDDNPGAQAAGVPATEVAGGSGLLQHDQGAVEQSQVGSMQQPEQPQQPQQPQPQQQRPKYYYYDPNAGVEEDAECLAGLADDLDDDDDVVDTGGGGGGGSSKQAAGGSSGAGGNSVLMQLLGQYRDENEIDIDDAEDE